MNPSKLKVGSPGSRVNIVRVRSKGCKTAGTDVSQQSAKLCPSSQLWESSMTTRQAICDGCTGCDGCTCVPSGAHLLLDRPTQCKSSDKRSVSPLYYYKPINISQQVQVYSPRQLVGAVRKLGACARRARCSLAGACADWTHAGLPGGKCTAQWVTQSYLVQPQPSCGQLLQLL